MKRIAWILVAAGLAAFLVIRVVQKQRRGPDGRRGIRPVAVSLAPVARRTIRDVAEFTGTLHPRAEFVVAPKVAGRLERLAVDIGDTVTNGMPIAELDADEYRQQVEQARAELEVTKAGLIDAQSALDVSQREFERVRALREQRVAAVAELDQAEALFMAAKAKREVALAQIRQREAALRSAEIRLAYTSIAAAWQDGGGSRAVAERYVAAGTMLRANDPVVSLVDVDTVIAVIHVIERDFPTLRIGQQAEVMTDAYESRSFTGTVARVAPILREETRQARVELQVPNSDRLLAPGMFVKVRIQMAEHADAAVVPSAAVTRRDGRAGVFVADAAGRTAAFVPVRSGIVAAGLTEILEPDLDGPVVTLGHHLLEHQASIAVAGPAAAPPEARPPEATAR